MYQARPEPPEHFLLLTEERRPTCGKPRKRTDFDTGPSISVIPCLLAYPMRLLRLPIRELQWPDSVPSTTAGTSRSSQTTGACLTPATYDANIYGGDAREIMVLFAVAFEFEEGSVKLRGQQQQRTWPSLFTTLRPMFEGAPFLKPAIASSFRPRHHVGPRHEAANTL